MSISGEVVYDIEVLPNLFTLTALDRRTGLITVFEVSPRHNHYHRMIEWLHNLRKNNYVMVGFNNYHYDYPVLHSILSVSDDKFVISRAFQKSVAVIEDTRAGNRFAHTIWDRDMFVPQMDLFKIHHFDNKAKMVSLKRLEFNMRRPSIVEWDGDFTKAVDLDRIDDLIRYNVEDVLATTEFRRHSEEAVAFRKTLVPEFGIEVLNYNDTKIGEKLIQRKLEEAVGTSKLYDFEERDDGSYKRKPKQTAREKVYVRDILFPIYSWKNEGFRGVFEQVRGLVVFVSGQRFEWNPREDYLVGKREVARCRDVLRTLGRGTPEYAEKLQECKVLEETYSDLDISYQSRDITFEFGKGGLHAARPWGAYKDIPGCMILDVDVASFYPSIAIEYGMKPEHLPPQFTEIYSGLRRERLAYKKTDPARAKMLKLALNGTYGKTNSIYSMLYDPEYSLRTVINGQMMLLMLWDMVSAELPDVDLIQANTDGLSFVLKRTDFEKCKEICDEWMRITRMELEFTEYESMFLRDVNNYVARDIDGKVKAKGAYNWKELYTGSSDGVVWNKNHSNVISQMAACAYLLDGTPVEETITKHRNIYDFFLCTNVGHGSRLYWGNREIQRNTRYVASRSGEELIKVMPPLPKKPGVERRIAINKGQKVQICNTVTRKWPDIDYDFYIFEAEQLVKGFKL